MPSSTSPASPGSPTSRKAARMIGSHCSTCISGAFWNVLEAALPLMAAAGHGHILGVTSGSGWRAADAGGYSSAKRAVAALTWQLGHQTPPGVTVNTMSPIANTRMVAAALERARAAGACRWWWRPLPEHDPGAREPRARSAPTSSATDFGWCSGQVLFAGGSEVGRRRPAPPARGGPYRRGGLPRRGPAGRHSSCLREGRGGTGELTADPTPASGRSSTSRRPPRPDRHRCRLGHVVRGRQRPPRHRRGHHGGARGPRHRLPPRGGGARLRRGRRLRCSSVVDRTAPVDALVVALAGRAPTASPGAGWQQLLADHRGIVQRLHADAAWARAAADYAASTDRPIRLVTLTDATTPSGRSRAQASAQQARVAAGGDEGTRHRLRRRASKPPRKIAGPRSRRTGLPAPVQSRRCRARRGRAGRERGLDRAAQSPSTHRCRHLRWPGRPLVARRRPAGHRPRPRGLE